jgi:hypothetical protein
MRSLADRFRPWNVFTEGNLTTMSATWRSPLVITPNGEDSTGIKRACIVATNKYQYREIELNWDACKD